MSVAGGLFNAGAVIARFGTRIIVSEARGAAGMHLAAAAIGREPSLTIDHTRKILRSGGGGIQKAAFSPRT